MRKYYKIILFTLCSALILMSSFYFTKAYIRVAINANTKNATPTPTIVIDAGHGGEDGGAVAADNTNEKDINLSIANKIVTLCQISGFNVVSTRTTDTAIYDQGITGIKNQKISDMKNRLAIFNSSSDNIVISIHQNKFTESKYYGTQVFYSKNNPDSEILAECVRSNVIDFIQPENNRETKPATKSIYLLWNTSNPAIIVECGFLSNNEELEKLKSDEYQNLIAFTIYSGLLDYYANN